MSLRERLTWLVEAWRREARDRSELHTALGLEQAADELEACLAAPPRVGATCPHLDELGRLVRRELRGTDRARALELIEWQRGAHMELRAWAGEEREHRRLLSRRAGELIRALYNPEELEEPGNVQPAMDRLEQVLRGGP
jgi:hypothetical protein